MLNWRAVTLLLFVLSAFACEEKKPAPMPEKEQADAEKAAEADPARADADAEVKPEAEPAPEAKVAWEPVAADALTDAQRAQLERAKKARQEMGGTMLGLVSRTVKDEGFEAAIEVCSGKAPEIAAQVAREHDVKLGRTSFKLRNARNTAPEWAREHVARKSAEPLYVANKDGGFGELSAIKVGPPCLKCHGQADQLGPGVADTLAKLYPEDRATGFAAGDLRGWFWVEVN